MKGIRYVIEYRSGDWLNGASGPEWVEQPSALVEFDNGLRGLVFLPDGPEPLAETPHSERAGLTIKSCVLRLGKEEGE